MSAPIWDTRLLIVSWTAGVVTFLAVTTMIRLLVGTELANCAEMMFEACTDSRLLPDVVPCERESAFPSLRTAGIRTTRAIIQKTTTSLCLLTTSSPSLEKAVAPDFLLFALLGDLSVDSLWRQSSRWASGLLAGS